MKWYRNPILCLALAIPALTVLASMFTVYLAVSSREAPVLEGYQKKGLSPLKIDKRDTDITAQVRGEALWLRAEPPLREDLRLHFQHPSRASEDWSVILPSQAENFYPLPPAVLQALRQERWYLRIEPLDRAWHLQGSTYDRGNRNRLRTELEFSSQ